MLLWALLGCETPDKSAADREHYEAALRSPRPTQPALGLCHKIHDAELSGDCALSVVTVADAPPGSLCEQVPDGKWREECWFLSAEAINRRGDSLQAAAYCKKAGRFALDCAQHLWQTPVHALIHGPGADAFAEVLPEAEALYAAWEPSMAAQTDFAERFWAKFFGNGFEGQGSPVDLRWCDPLPEVRRAACVSAGVAHYAREIGPRVESAGGLEPMCALPVVDVEALSPWLTAVPDARLSAAAAVRVAEICASHPHRQRR